MTLSDARNETEEFLPPNYFLLLYTKMLRVIVAGRKKKMSHLDVQLIAEKSTYICNKCDRKFNR